MVKAAGAAEAAKFIRENEVKLSEVAEELRRLDAERQQQREAKERWLTIAETLAHIRVSRSTLWRLIRKGQLKAIKFSNARAGKVIVSSTSIEALLASMCVVKREQDQ